MTSRLPTESPCSTWARGKDKKKGRGWGNAVDELFLSQASCSCGQHLPGGVWVSGAHLSLKGDGDRLEAAVRVLTDAPAGGGRAKLLGGTIVEHEPRRHLCCEGLVVEDGVHMEAVAHPVAGRGGQHLPSAPKVGQPLKGGWKTKEGAFDCRPALSLQLDVPRPPRRMAVRARAPEWRARAKE
eukprot:scaffold20324_cov81-Isochrysis_galbana.AAC.1